MDRVDKMRAKQAERAERADGRMLEGGPPQPDAATADGPAKPAKPPKPPKPAGGPKPMVVFSCGHQKPVAAFKGGACGECRNKAQRERNARRRAEAAAREPKLKLDDKGRLPDGSRFEVAYDGAKVCWSGTLAVRFGPELSDVRTFSGTAGGVEHLLRDLARQFREWAAAQVRP